MIVKLFERRRRLITELKACAIAKNLLRGKQLHEHAIQDGDESNVHVANTLINMYAKCGSMVDARRVVDGMKAPDAISWTTIMLGYAANGKSEYALRIFSQLDTHCLADTRTFTSAVKICAALAAKEGGSGKRRLKKIGQALHLLACRCVCDSNMYLENTLMDLYIKCGVLKEARKVFERMQDPDVVSWTALMFGYTEEGENDKALELFSQMGCEGCTPNERTFVAALNACTGLAGKKLTKQHSLGIQIHLLASQYGYDSHIFVQSALVDMYAKYGRINKARRVFEDMKEPDVVCWTALILGYASNGDGETAIGLFLRMKSEGCLPNDRTFVAVVKAASNLPEENATRSGKVLHCLARREGFCSYNYLENTLVDLYAKCGSMEDARQVFYTIEHPDVVSWTALILGYADNGQSEISLSLYTRMRNEACCSLDATTFLSVLKACGNLGDLEFGRKVHSEICNLKLEDDNIVANSLVDFYAKCGSFMEAEQVISRVESVKKDMVTWTTLMSGYSRHGETRGVFDTFQRLLDYGLRPNSITFLCLLAACNHAGLVDRAKEYFELMTSTYGIYSNVAHYNCMIDILGRANMLDDAMALLRKMAFNPTGVTWMAVLGACRKWRKAELGRFAFENMTGLEHGNSGAYVLVADIYKKQR